MNPQPLWHVSEGDALRGRPILHRDVHRASAPEPAAAGAPAPVPAGAGRPATRLIRAWGRTVGGAAILAFLLWRLGTGPFLDGVRLIDGRALAAALLIGAVT